MHDLACKIHGATSGGVTLFMVIVIVRLIVAGNYSKCYHNPDKRSKFGGLGFLIRDKPVPPGFGGIRVPAALG